jgi:hypothetical protein
LWFQSAAYQGFKAIEERRMAEWPPRATVIAKFSKILLRQGTVQEALPVGNHRTKRSDFHQAVVAAQQVRAGKKRCQEPFAWHFCRLQGRKSDSQPKRRSQAGPRRGALRIPPAQFVPHGASPQTTAAAVSPQ